MSFAEKLQECPLIAILRGITPAEIEPVCEVLYESGFRMIYLGTDGWLFTSLGTLNRKAGKPTAKSGVSPENDK